MRSKLFLFVAMTCLTLKGLGQDDTKQSGIEIYGFAMTDAGYNVKQINPNWYDAMRVTKLPTYKNQYAPDGNTFFGVRQTRFGVKGFTPTAIGQLKVVYEFDMFGVGADEGQTTMRLRHAYGEIGHILVGQTNSVFMDGDEFPNVIEYWGPSGMVFFRNVQIRVAALTGDKELFFSLEKPGASADQGPFQNRIELDSVVGHFPLPDVAAHFKMSGKWGHLQLAGIVREIEWKDIHTTGGYDLTGSTVGWGLHLSTSLQLGKNNVFRGSIVYGEGVENYMNDAPVDIGIDTSVDNSKAPIKGKPLPVTGFLAYFEHSWSPTLSSTIGVSGIHIDNTQYGSANAYKDGEYASVNLLATPFKNMLIGAEVQYGKRTNFSDGFSADDVKVQLSFKYNFSQSFFFDKK